MSSGPYIAQPYNANSLPLKDQADGTSVAVTIDSGDLFVGGVELAKIEDLSSYVLTSAMQAAPTKATPIDADGVSIIDSAASNAFKRVLWSQIKATLKTYFDTLYSAASWGSITGTLSSQTDLQTALNAKVTSGGALGTPSSGTVTNLTGTASININGTVGATTPTTVACTTLNASGTASITGIASFLDIIRSSNGNGIYLATSGSYGAGTRLQNLGVDGKMRFSNGAATGGVYLDTTVADTLTIRNLADSAGGNLACLGITIGAGTKILKALSATATLDFGSVSANSFADLTITVTGAALGDTVSIGVPNGSLLNDISFFGWVSATNTVAVRCSNVSSTTARDPASGTFRATVTQF